MKKGLTMLVRPAFSEASSSCGHVFPEGAVFLIKCHDEGGYHGDENAFLRHSLFAPYLPRHVMINGDDFLLGIGLIETIPGEGRHEKLRKEIGGDYGDQEGEVVDLVLACVRLEDPVVSFVDILMSGRRRAFEVSGKDGSVEVHSNSAKVLRTGEPRSLAIGSDGVVIGDGLRFDGRGESGLKIVRKDGVVGGGPETEISPTVKDGDSMRGTPPSGVLLGSREEVDLKDVQGGPYRGVKKSLLSVWTLLANDLTNGSASDFENGKESAIFKNRRKRRACPCRGGHVDQKLGKVCVRL
jgi:hypothetical protein